MTLAAGAAALAYPALLQACAASAPIRIGLLSELPVPTRMSGARAKVPVELAVADFGGSFLGHPTTPISYRPGCA